LQDAVINNLNCVKRGAPVSRGFFYSEKGFSMIYTTCKSIQYIDLAMVSAIYNQKIIPISKTYLQGMKIHVYLQSKID